MRFLLLNLINFYSISFIPEAMKRDHSGKPKPEVSPEVANLMTTKMAIEYEFYDFVLQRFNAIYKAVFPGKSNT